MGIGICVNCQTRYAYDDLNSSDYVHRCNSSNLVLDQEDVVNIGTHDIDNGWVNQGTVTENQNRLIIAGTINKIDGTRGALEGERVPSFTIRGNNANTTRIRQHYQYIEKAGIDK